MIRRSAPLLTIVCYLFSINMLGTWSCEAGKLCGTWLGKHCCEHPDDHPDSVFAGQTVIDHEDHSCRFSPLATNPRAVFSASPPSPSDSGIAQAASLEIPLLAIRIARLIPESRGPPGTRLRPNGAPGLRAPPAS